MYYGEKYILFVSLHVQYTRDSILERPDDQESPFQEIPGRPCTEMTFN
jgi:hypothetical protein